ncbi:hypothetical protein FRC12_001009 [Ceratobasidium sp. 428]|nr:hypothetical protein FRC12_001009 [Ceratobasidium sp. 428]
MIKLVSALGALLLIAEPLTFSSALPTTIPQANLEKLNCVFSISPDENTSLEYNLCPLLEHGQYRVSREVETPPSITKIHYDISLQQNIAWDGTLPARDQCEVGTNICMTVISERPDHRLEPPRTIYVVPVAGSFQGRQLNATSKIAPHTDASGRAPLEMTFHGGSYMGIAQEATFSFHCDPTIKEPSEPTLTSHGDPLEDQGKHALSWISRHACPVGGYPETRQDNPPQTSPTPPAPERRISSNVVQINAVMYESNSANAYHLVIALSSILAIVIGVVLLRRLIQRHSGRDSRQYRSLALSHIGSTLHHEADSRSPLSPHTSDPSQARRYAST